MLEIYESRYFESYDSSSIILENMDQYSSLYKDAYGNPTRMAKLPAIYILGYLNVQKDIFINNSNYAFDSYKRDINVSNLKLILEKKYEKILRLRKKGINSVNTRVKDYEEDLERLSYQQILEMIKQKILGLIIKIDNRAKYFLLLM